MNTEFSAVVNYLANLNDSGVDQALSDREDAVWQSKKGCPFRLRVNANNTPDFTQNQRHVKKDVGEKLTDEEAENMIKVTEVDNAQWNRASVCQ